MRALPELMAAVPNAHVIMIGADGGGYTGARGGKPWRFALLDELKGRLDLSRLHFPGRVPHKVMLEALSVSAAHVYYTYPFVLSWSLLEAMACECVVLASDTAPVRDAITDGVNGRLLDFFDVGALSKAMIDACRNPKRYEPLRKAARETVLNRFDRPSLCEPAWMKLIDEVLAAPSRAYRP
jgi:glycosyltransferase involved in cell wall biosynthesis